ncbi:hypothetical protein K2X30_07590 [bacterium]|nr:hypothetical protein [bacterium]
MKHSVIFSAFLIFSTAALGAEVYSATDGETLGPDVIAPLPQQAESGVPAAPVAPVTKVAPLKPSKKAVAAAKPPRRKRGKNSAAKPFDQVPEVQAEAIASRLKIVEQMILKHGRAYDYRTHTVAELQKILARLDRKYVAQHQVRPVRSFQGEPALPPPPVLLPDQTEIFSQ